MKNYRFSLNEQTFFYIALLLTVFVRLRFANAPLERDEGEYAYAGMMILRGQLPYSDFYNMKLPGVYYLYALIFKIFGQSVPVIRHFLLFVNLLTAFFVFKTAKNWLSREAAWWASGIFLLLSFSFHAQGWIANCEQFANLFVAISLVFLTKKWSALHLFLCGLMLGVATLMKQHAFHFAVFPAFLLVKQLFSERLILGRFKIFLRLGTAFGIGYTLPLAATIYFFWQKGILDAFYFYIIQYATAYSTLHAQTFEHIDNLAYVLWDNTVLWLAAFGGIFMILKNNFTHPKNSKNQNEGCFLSVDTEGGYLLILFFISLISVCPGWYFRPHYFQFLFVPAALLMAYCIDNYGVLFGAFARKVSRSQLLVFSFLGMFAVQLEYFFVKTPEEMTARMYKWGYFSEIRQMADYLKEQVKENEYIGQIGNEPEIWFYAKTKAASGFLYAYPLIENHKFAPKFAEQFVKENEWHHPDWFIYSNLRGKEEHSKTDKYLDTWAKNYLKDFELKGILYGVDKLNAVFETHNLKVDTTCDVIYEVYKRKKN